MRELTQTNKRAAHMFSGKVGSQHTGRFIFKLPTFKKMEPLRKHRSHEELDVECVRG